MTPMEGTPLACTLQNVKVKRKQWRAEEVSQVEDERDKTYTWNVGPELGGSWVVSDIEFLLLLW